jgi:hypothetical protein
VHGIEDIIPAYEHSADVEGSGRMLGSRARPTLWAIIEKRRFQRGAIAVWFVVLWTGCVGLALLGVIAYAEAVPLWLQSNESLNGAVLAPLQGMAGSWTELGVLVTNQLAPCFLSAALVGLLYVAWAWRRPEWRLIARRGDERVTAAQAPTTFLALREMSLAAGFEGTPGMYLLRDVPGMNAVVVGRAPETAVVGVTRELAAAELATQRAVMAVLLSRFREGGVSWTTLLATLAMPLAKVERRVRKMLDASERRPLTKPLAGLVAGLFILGGVISTTDVSGEPRYAALQFAGLVLFGIGLTVSLSAASAYVLWYLFDVSFRSASTTMILSADADALILLKDPDELRRTLDTSIRQRNAPRRLRDLSYLAFVPRGDARERESRLSQIGTQVWHAGEPAHPDRLGADR